MELCVRLVYALGVDIPGSGATKPVHDHQNGAGVCELRKRGKVAGGHCHDGQAV